MAKRYDTPADFERDKLKEQSAQLRLASSEQSNNSWFFLAGSFLADAWNAGRATASTALRVLGIGMFTASVISLIQSWRLSSKAHDLDLKNARLGPQTVVLPPDAAPQEDCNSCTIKRFTEAAQPKTLIDFAEKSLADIQPGKH